MNNYEKSDCFDSQVQHLKHYTFMVFLHP